MRTAALWYRIVVRSRGVCVPRRPGSLGAQVWRGECCSPTGPFTMLNGPCAILHADRGHSPPPLTAQIKRSQVKPKSSRIQVEASQADQGLIPFTPCPRHRLCQKDPPCSLLCCPQIRAKGSPLTPLSLTYLRSTNFHPRSSWLVYILLHAHNVTGYLSRTHLLPREAPLSSLSSCSTCAPHHLLLPLTRLLSSLQNELARFRMSSCSSMPSTSLPHHFLLPLTRLLSSRSSCSMRSTRSA